MRLINLMFLFSSIHTQNKYFLVRCLFLKLFLFSCIWGQERTGCIEGNCYNGIGKYRYSNGDVYEGGFKEKKKNGYGKYNFSNGDKYRGE